MFEYTHLLQRSMIWFLSAIVFVSSLAIVLPMSVFADTAALNQYRSSTKGDYWVTTGSVTTPEYQVFGTNPLGYLLTSQKTGTVPLYGCWSGTDHFTALSSTCDGLQVLRTEGYMYSTQPWWLANRAIYRCYIQGVHSVAFDNTCAGGVADYGGKPLGWVQTLAVNPPTGFLSTITTEGVVPGWATDPAAPTQAVNVQFYVDGPMGSGTLAGTTKADFLGSDLYTVLGSASAFLAQRIRDFLGCEAVVSQQGERVVIEW